MRGALLGAMLGGGLVALAATRVGCGGQFEPAPATELSDRAVAITDP